MYRIDIASENGYGNAAGTKDPTESAGVSRAQGTIGVWGIREGFGEGQLDGRGLVWCKDLGQLLCRKPAQVMGP